MHLFSEFSFWWILPILVLSFLTTFVFYRNIDWLNSSPFWVHKTLFLLRFVSVFFVLILLLGIILETITYRDEKPIILTLLDSSSSMKNYKDSSEVAYSISNLNQKLNKKFSSNYELINYTIGETVKKNSSIEFKEKQSNLQLGFEAIASQYYRRNIGAIVFISDGNFNKGVSPIYAAKNIPLAPIFSIGVGDTISKKDQSIQAINSNDFAFLRAKFPVEIDIESSKLMNQTSKVSVIHLGKVIASKSVTFSNKSTENKHITFELEADKIGFQQYRVEISPLQNEYTYKNNSSTFYIEIIDNRNKVLLLSGAPHPDLTALKSTLEKDENIQVKIANSTQWKEEYGTSDLVIWHEPGIEFSSITYEKLKALKKPVFYFIGPNTSSALINQLNLGFTASQGRQTDEVQAFVSSSVNVFEMSSDISKEIAFLPPVFVKYGELQFSNPVEVLLYQKLGNIVKKDPLLFFGKRNQVGYGVFYGEGIWKWKFYEYAKTKDTRTVDQLFQKVFSYLLVKENKSALHVTLPRKFSAKEEVRIKAEFYNPSMELITSPEIKFELIDEHKKKYVYQFGITSNFYTLPLGTLYPGNYTWIASSVYGGKNHVKKGTFYVENEQIEQIDTKANHLLLRQISQQSNGKFFSLKESNNLLSIIENRDDIASVSYEQKSNLDLLDYAWILILILVLLSAEWFIKKWFGGY